jgi:hypothetical protein
MDFPGAAKAGLYRCLQPVYKLTVRIFVKWKRALQRRIGMDKSGWPD